MPDLGRHQLVEQFETGTELFLGVDNHGISRSNGDDTAERLWTLGVVLSRLLQAIPHFTFIFYARIVPFKEYNVEWYRDAETATGEPLPKWWRFARRNPSGRTCHPLEGSNTPSGRQRDQLPQHRALAQIPIMPMMTKPTRLMAAPRKPNGIWVMACR